MNKNKKSIFNNFLDKFKRNKKESDPKVNNNKKEENSFPITDEEKENLFGSLMVLLEIIIQICH